MAGPVNETVATALPDVATPIMGASGTVPTGVTLFDTADADPVPAAFIARTVNVYAVPFVSPDTTMDVHGAMQLAVRFPGDEVAA